MRGLYVAVPEDRFRADPGTGAGRVWESVVARLARRVKVTPLAAGRSSARQRLLWRAPHVWLAPGHEGPVRATEPVVTVMHGTPWTVEPTLWDLVDRTYAKQFIELTEATLRTADFVIVPSEYARTALLAGYEFAEDRVVVVHHGVDSTVFNPRQRGGARRVAAVFGREAPYVLFASVAAPQKNLPALIEAMDALHSQGFPHVLAIAGAQAPVPPDPLADVLARMPGMSSRIAWLGHLEDGDLAGLMGDAAAFCLPSHFESFGLTALEGLACGVPVVVSDRGALPEVVGDAAVTTQPTAQAITAALKRVLSDDEVAATLRAAGPERARTMNWDRTTDGWLSVLQRAAETG